MNKYANTLIQNQGCRIYKDKEGSYFNFLCYITSLKYILKKYQIGTVDLERDELEEMNQIRCFEYAIRQLLPE